MPADARVRIEPPAAPLEIEARAYRGALEIFGNSRRTLTVVNELPLEDYLLGVVPNELNPAAFGQLEALKAQAVAARTYIQRNLGQYRRRATTSARPTRARCTSACSPRIRSRRRRSWRRAASSRRTTASRSTRSTAPPAAGAPRTPSTSSPRRCPTWCRSAASTSTPRWRSRRRERFRTGRTACSRLRASRTSATRRGSWALRAAR